MTKTQLSAKLEAWSKASRKRLKIEKDRENQLQTLIDTYEKKAEPINAQADRQLDPIMEDLHTLEADIRTAMLAGVKPDGSIEIPQIENQFALAQVTIDKKREINSAAFLRAVPPSRRNEPGFFKCLSILITPAEKFLDAVTMARLVRPKLTPSVHLTLKEE